MKFKILAIITGLFNNLLPKINANTQTELTENTERLKIDNETFITRIVRPIILLSFVFSFLYVIIYEKSIEKSNLDLLTELLIFSISFYFGGRTFEKIIKSLKK